MSTSLTSSPLLTFLPLSAPSAAMRSPRLRHSDGRQSWGTVAFRLLRSAFPYLLLTITGGLVAVSLSFAYSSSLSSHPSRSPISPLPSAPLPPDHPPPSLALIRRPPFPFPNSTGAAASWAASHVLFFVHIPKTAGQSFSSVLAYAARPYSATTGRDGPLKTDRSPRMDLTFMQTREMVAAVKPAGRQHFLAVHGRQLFHVGHADTLVERVFAEGGKDTEFVTLLRRPVDRVLSHYCYIVRSSVNGRGDSLVALNPHAKLYPTWTAHVRETREPVSRASFQRFVEGQHTDGLDNWHTRAYAGCLHTAVVKADEQPPLCSDPLRMLEEAKRRLASFLYLGLLEEYVQSEKLLLYTLHYDPTQFAYTQRPRPVNRNAKKSECVTMVVGEGAEEEAMRRWIGGYEALDASLYDWAAEVFWMRVAAMPPGPHNVSVTPEGEKVREAGEALGGKARLPRPGRNGGQRQPTRRTKPSSGE